MGKQDAPCWLGDKVADLSFYILVSPFIFLMYLLLFPHLNTCNQTCENTGVLPSITHVESAPPSTSISSSTAQSALFTPRIWLNCSDFRKGDLWLQPRWFCHAQAPAPLCDASCPWSQSQKFYDHRNQLAAQVNTLTAGVGVVSYTCATGWRRQDLWRDPTGQPSDTAASQVDLTEMIYFLICRQQLSWAYTLLN